MSSLGPMVLVDSRTRARRRFIFASCVLLLTSLATWVFADILWRGGGISGMEIFLLVLFVPLFANISLGFTQSLIGFLFLLHGGDRRRITLSVPTPTDATRAVKPPVTAITIPIFNEDVSRVYEGIRVVYEALEKAGALQGFDFFILSDSNDPNKWIEEEVAWVELCKQVKGFGRIFYRKRRLAINRKSGNISDFCRRWGRKYRYMLILDADSIMDPGTLVNLVALMEANPQAGIIQTAPKLVRGESFFGRLMQFANSLYAPVFLAGLNYWQGGDGNYWGHNAIIRVAPFMDHCALPDIPGMGSHKFMSHDYVEAALMRRAGYEVWLAYDLGGSYEGGPPTFVDNAKRDRRWCRGNLQHGWLLFARGIPVVNRLHLLLGIFSYVASLLWLLSLVFGTVYYFTDVYLAPPRYDADVGLSAFLDIGGSRLALLLFIVTLAILTMPKVFSVLLVLGDRERRAHYGGAVRVIGSSLLEHLLSALLAPVQMLFHAWFVITILMGRTVGWGAQRRGGEDGIDWREAILTHGGHTLIGLLWAFYAYSLNPAFFWWLSPVLAGMLVSIPLSVLLSKVSVGQWLKQNGLFLIPEETDRLSVIRELDANLDDCRTRLPPFEPLRRDHAFMEVALDPYVNAVHVSLLRQRKRSPRRITEHFARLLAKVTQQGPGILNRREQVALLMHPEALESLHHQLWQLPERELSSWWVMAMRQYNVVTTQPVTALHL